MNFSKHGEELLKQWEGCILHIYPDSSGKPTIGIGHLLTKDEIANGKFKSGITLDEAFALLEKDILPAIDDVNKHVTQSLNQNQFDALVIFTFNIGTHGFDTSSALQAINEKHFDEVPDDMRKWNKITKNGQHVVDEGLVNRREKEIELWNGKI